jgi:Tfp pilus assembly protein PilN
MLKDKHKVRMNFIAKKGLVLDYQHLVFFLVAWFVLLAFITGAEYFRLWLMKHDVVRAKARLATLMQDQERRLAMLQLTGPKLDKSKQQSLIAMFENPPKWSRAMAELQSRIPRHVRLTLLKSAENIKEGKFYLRVEGVAPSMRSVVEFMQRVQASPVFRDISLGDSKRSETNNRIFTFSLDMQVIIMGA